MFQVDLRPILTKNGFVVDDNAGVVDGRLRVRQELVYKTHRVIAIFILMIDEERKITEVTCNIESIFYNKDGWKEFNEEVTQLLKNNCCEQLKGSILPAGQKKIIK